MNIIPLNGSSERTPSAPLEDEAAAEQLTQAYRQIADTLDGLDIGACVFDAEDRSRVWNRSFLRIFPEHDGHVHAGEPYRENLRRFYARRLSAADMPEIERHIADGIRRHRAQTQPFVFFHDGQWLRVSSLPLPQGARIRVWTRIPSPGSNLTIPLGADQGQSQLASLEKLADGVMALDEAGRVVSVNEPFLSLYGFASRAAVLGRPYAELLREAWGKTYQSTSARAVVDRALARLSEDRRFTGVSFEIPLPGERWLRVTEQHGGDGVTYSTHVDISAMKRQQEIVDQARLAAERANQAKTTFLAMMSHEVRTPMHGIIGMAELLLEGELDERQRHYAELVKSSATGLLGILNDILDVSRLEIGRMTLETREFRPAELIGEVARLLRTGAREAELYLDVEVEPALREVFLGDPSRVRQVLLNLATNAVKFTARGGVSITATLPEGSRLRIEVRDTGIGFEEDRLDQLFQPFEQAETSTARRFGGAGLGLAISRQLVELMGGRIGARSLPGVGSVFWFEIPLPRPVAQVPLSEGSGRKRRILLVEDHATSQVVVRMMLDGAGHEVEVVGDGTAALAAAEARPPDLVLLDLQLPDMDGFAVAARLRKIFAAASVEVPILALTADAVASRRDDFLTEGFSDHLPKPFTKRALLAKLEAWLALGKPAAA